MSFLFLHNFPRIFFSRFMQHTAFYGMTYHIPNRFFGVERYVRRHDHIGKPAQY